MMRSELNNIIESEHKNPVIVSTLVYDEVEDMYLKVKRMTKSEIGAFYQKYDYQGVRNALQILDNMEAFKAEVVDNVVMGNFTEVAPSQFALLEYLGWNVKKLNLTQTRPWVSCGK